MSESTSLQVNADTGELSARSFHQHSFVELSRPQNSTDREAATDESDPTIPGQKLSAVRHLLGVGRLIGAHLKINIVKHKVILQSIYFER